MKVLLKNKINKYKALYNDIKQFPHDIKELYDRTNHLLDMMAYIVNYVGDSPTECDKCSNFNGDVLSVCFKCDGAGVIKHKQLCDWPQ